MRWDQFASELGFASQSGRVFDGGRNARIAVAALLGDDVLRDAVESVVSLDRGSDLAYSVLSLLKPAVARDHCLAIVRHDPDSERRAFAASLFKDVSTLDDLPVVAELLEHPDPDVQVWGVSLLQVLSYQDEELVTGRYGAMAREHANPRVRAAYADIV
jgi:hypothetical protein